MLAMLVSYCEPGFTCHQACKVWLVTSKAWFVNLVIVELANTYLHASLLSAIMSLTSGAPAIDVMRQGLEDLRQLSQHILTTFKVSKQQEEREV